MIISIKYDSLFNATAKAYMRTRNGIVKMGRTRNQIAEILSSYVVVSLRILYYDLE